MATAADLALGEHSLACLDSDFFKVSNLKPGLLYVKLTHPDVGAASDLNMRVRKEDGTVIGSNFQANATEEVFIHLNVAGNYVIEVFQASIGSNSYTLEVATTFNASGDDGAEQDDNFDSAKEITDYNSTVTGRIAKDEDWFYFTAPLERLHNHSV